MKIDMDRTIADMLKKYRAYIATLIAYEEKEAQKIKDDIDYEFAEQDLLNLKRADKFLKLIVENPKKYLYWSADMTYMTVDGDNVRLCRGGEKTIFNELKPIFDLGIKYKTVNLLPKLSEYISLHVKHLGIGSWIYDDKNISDLNNSDYESKIILELNKTVNLLPFNNFERVFKNMMPARRFAIRQEKLR